MSDPLAGPESDTQQVEERAAIAAVPWSVRDAIVVMALWLVSAVFIGGFVLFLLRESAGQAQAQAAGLSVTAVLFIGITVGYVGARYRDGMRQLFGPAKPSLSALGYGLAVGVVGLVVIGYGLGTLLQIIAAALDTQLPEIQEGFRDLASDRASAPLLAFGSVLVAPLAEEIFYRGMLFPALRRNMSMWPAMGISATIFGLSHLQTSVEGYLLVLLLIIPLGMLLAWAYERSGTLLVPVVAHAAFNAIQVAVLITNPAAA